MDPSVELRHFEGELHGWAPARSAIRALMIKISTINYHGKVKRSEADEYIEVANDGVEAVDISNWVINAGAARQDFAFRPGTVLAPGARARVYTNQLHAESGGFSFGIRRAIWNNQGDTGTLRDADGKTVDSYTYPQQAPDVWVFSTLSPGGEGVHDFGDQPVEDGAKTATFTVENRGSEPLVLTGASPASMVGGVAFTIVSQPDSPIAPRARAQFELRFDPASAGRIRGTLRIAIEGLDAPFEVSLAGTGVAADKPSPPPPAQAEMSLRWAREWGQPGVPVEEGANYDIGTIPAGQPGSSMLIIANTGDAPLNYTLLLDDTGGTFLLNETNTYMEDQIPPGRSGGVYPSISFRPPPGQAPRGRRAVQVTVTSDDPRFARVRFCVSVSCQ